MDFDYNDLGEDSVAIDRDGDRSSSGWRRAPSRRMGLVIVLLAAIVAGGSLWKQPFYAVSPGSVRDTASRIEVVDSPVFAPEGEIGFVTDVNAERAGRKVWVLCLEL